MDLRKLFAKGFRRLETAGNSPQLNQRHLHHALPTAMTNLATALLALAFLVVLTILGATHFLPYGSRATLTERR